MILRFCVASFAFVMLPGMAKKKTSEKLTAIPRPTRRQRTDSGRQSDNSAGTAPDISYIAEDIRLLAVPVGELIFDPANARQHPEPSISAIAASLRVYGQCKPVVCLRESGKVIAGNGTLQAALSLRWTHLAAVKVDMDAATAAGFSIADNRTAQLSSWDAEALDKLLREVSTGNDARLDEMLAELAEEVGIVPAEGTEQAGNDVNEVYRGMPEFQHEELPHAHMLRVFFPKQEDLEAFGKLIGQEVTGKKEVWYPAKFRGQDIDKGYVADCHDES